MGEIDDPALRLTVLGLCVRLAGVDDLVAEGESVVLMAALAHWRLSLQPRYAPQARHAAQPA